MPPYCYQCNAPCEDGKCKCPPKVFMTRLHHYEWECPECGEDHEETYRPEAGEVLICGECKSKSQASYSI